MIESYKETKVALAPSGELCLMLPIYANQVGAIFTPEQLNLAVGAISSKKDNSVELSLGFYEHLGYLIYSEKLGYCYFFNKKVEEEMEILSEL